MSHHTSYTSAPLSPTFKAYDVSKLLVVNTLVHTKSYIRRNGRQTSVYVRYTHQLSHLRRNAQAS